MRRIFLILAFFQVSFAYAEVLILKCDTIRVPDEKSKVAFSLLIDETNKTIKVNGAIYPIVKYDKDIIAAKKSAPHFDGGKATIDIDVSINRITGAFLYSNITNITNLSPDEMEDFLARNKSIGNSFLGTCQKASTLF